MFKIGEFSRLANVSVRMLRHYDKLGLLTPEVVDQYAGYRYYPARQLAQVNRIQQLKALGFSLNTIKSILEAQSDEELRESDHDVEVQVSVEGEYLDNDGVCFYTMPAVQVASVTFNGPFEQTPYVMEALATWIEANNYQITGPMFNISHVSPAHDPDPSNWVTESCYQVSKS